MQTPTLTPNSLLPYQSDSPLKCTQEAHTHCATATATKALNSTLMPKFSTVTMATHVMNLENRVRPKRIATPWRPLDGAHPRESEPFSTHERMRFFLWMKSRKSYSEEVQACQSFTHATHLMNIIKHKARWFLGFGTLRMEAATRSRDCETLHAEMAVSQLRGGMRERTAVSLDDDDDDDKSSAVASLLVEASTSGRVESAFWDERRQRRRRRRRAWASPTGALYVVSRPSNFVYNELEQGRKVEENVSIDVKHSVSTCFEQGRLGEEKSILMMSSHKLDANHLLTTHYVNNLDGDFEYTCNTSHAIPASRLSTCLHLTSIADPTLEVELEQEQETKKMSETILANLRTGERFLKLHVKNNITDNVALSNTYITDLRGNHSVKLEAALPLFGFANISKSFTTNFQESREFCLNAQQRINELRTLKTEFIRNNNQVSVELKHVAQGTSDVAMKLTRDHQGSTQFKVTTSHTRQANCWGWTFRKVSGEAYSVGVELKREVNPDKFLLLRTSAQNKRCTVYAELRRPF